MHARVPVAANKKRHYSSTSSTFGARSRFTAPEVSGAGVALVVAEEVASFVAAEEAAATDFLDFFFFVCHIS